MTEAYLIIDSSSGSIRAAVFSSDGKLLSLAARDINNKVDAAYPNALYFDFPEYNKLLISVCREAVLSAPGAKITAVSAASQREGIVLINKNGNAVIGLPNIDNRGLEFENGIEKKHRSYLLGGRWVSTLFPAVKLIGLRERRPDIYEQMSTFTSISDYIAYYFTGKLAYEISQACETLLLDIKKCQWSEELCERFEIPISCLPELIKCGTLLGFVKGQLCEEIGIHTRVPFYVGGADTQLAAEACLPGANEMVIVAGTTTPIVCLRNGYVEDEQERCWLNRHVRPDIFIVETNVGVSVINYQRAKETFYPGESYEAMEEELSTCGVPRCIASVGSMIFGEGRVTPNGGFVLSSPLDGALERKDFAYAVLLDYAFSFKNNFENNVSISGCRPSKILGCGNGFASKILPQLMADLIGQEIHIVDGYSHATMVGVHHLLSQKMGNSCCSKRKVIRTVFPEKNSPLTEYYDKWLNIRTLFNP